MQQLIVFLIAGIISFTATGAIRRIVLRKNIALAQPRARDVHTKPTPRLGGLAIAVSFWLCIGFVQIINPSALQFVDQTVLGIDRNLFGVLLGTLILVTVGAIDDIRGLSPAIKLFWQFVAALMLPLFGVHIQWLANPLGGANIELTGLLDGLISIGWIVLLINVLNFLDGLDGLASGVSLVAIGILYLLALAPFVNQPALALLLLILFGSVLGFLPFNWHPAKIFLGDSGSQLLGYLLGVAAIISGGKFATAVLVLAIPIFDALWAIVRRLASRRSPFAADKEHFHHRLLALGLPQPAVVLILMTLSALLGTIALMSRTAGKVQTLIIAALLMAIMLIVLAIAERLAKKRRNAL